MANVQPSPPPALVLGRLADERRLRALAAVALGASTVAAVAERAQLTDGQAARALAHLTGIGLVRQGPAGLEVDHRVFADAACQAAPERHHPDLRPITPEQERVVRHFVGEDGRLRALPVREAKRRLVLDWVASRFAPERAYPERDVNAVLRSVYDDVASLRRFLVDEGLMHRDAGVYRR